MQFILQTLIDGLLEGFILTLVSLGLALCLGFARIINLTHGSFITLSGFIAYIFFIHYGLHPFYALIVSVPTAFILGYAIYMACIRHMLRLTHWSNEIVMMFTLSFAIVLEEVVRIASHNVYVILPQYILPIEVMKIFIPPIKLIAGLTAIIILIALHLFMKYSKTGKIMRAVFQDRVLTELIGISSDKYYALASGMGASLAALAGVLISSLRTVAPHTSWELLLMSMTIIIVGGMGSLKGLFIISITWGIVSSIISLVLRAELSYLALLIILIIVLMVRPLGLFGKRIWRV